MCSSAFKNIDHLDSRSRLSGMVKSLLWLFKSFEVLVITINSHINCFPMKATFKSDPHQSVRWQWMQGNHLRGCSRGPWTHMLQGLGTLPEKGKAITCKPWEPPEERKLLWADERESSGLTSRFSSKVLGLYAPRAAQRDAGEWSGSRQTDRQRSGDISTWKSRVWLARSAPPHKVTWSMQEEGWSKTSQVGFLQLF